MSTTPFNAMWSCPCGVRRACLAAFAFLTIAAPGAAEFTTSKAQASVSFGYGFRRPIKILIEGATAPVTLGFSGLVLGTTATANHTVPVAGLTLTPTCQIGSGGWSGLNNSSGPVHGNFVPGPQTVTYKLNGVTVGTFSIGCGRDPTVDISYLASDYSLAWFTLPETLTVTLSLTSGVLPIYADPRGPTAPNPLAALAGKEMLLPFFGAPGSNTFEVGGVSSEVIGDAAGAGVLRFKIPANWDGTIKFNGQSCYVASPIASEFPYDQPGEMVGNLFGTDLPAGMTRWNPDSPLILPDGMTEGSKLPLPPGMTIAPSTTLDGKILGVKGTVDGVTLNYSYDKGEVATLPSTGTGAASGTGAATRDPGSGSDMSDGAAMSAADAAAAKLAGSSSSVNSGQATVDSLEGLREQLTTVFSAQGPLAPGNLPRNNTLAVSLPFGQFGNFEQNIDFGVAPWTVIRAAILVCFTIYLGASYIRFLHV